MARTNHGKLQAPRRILLVDDHPIVSEGLAELLNREGDLKVCGCCQSAKEAVLEVSRLNPDLVVVDIGLGGANGIDLIKQIRSLYEGLAVMVLSMHDERLYAERALKAGALGYVMKHTPVQELIGAIRQVLKGQCYLSQNMREHLLEFAGPGAQGVEKPGVTRLTDREIEVFVWLGNGLSTRDIASRLSISAKTVETYRAHIKEKLGLRNGSEILRAALEFAQNHVH
jgi:DNA-binding NarL/FixJ family response regulator